MDEKLKEILRESYRVYKEYQNEHRVEEEELHISFSDQKNEG